MADILAVVKKADSPSKLAFAELRKRVEEDNGLAVDLKIAFLEDLEGEAATSLAKLRAALAGAENDNAP